MLKVTVMKIHLIKYSLAVVLVDLFYSFGYSQKQNLIKINPLSPVAKTLNIQYEHVLGEKRSFQIGAYYTNTGTNSDDINGFGITPEYRMYFSLESNAPAGFFLAPFLRYQCNTVYADLYDEYSYDYYTAKANVNSIRPGLLIGFQKVYSNIVSFEYFLGPTYSFNWYNLKSKDSNESDFSTGLYEGFGLRCGITIGFAF
jgi:hypothetical protein